MTANQSRLAIQRARLFIRDCGPSTPHWRSGRQGNLGHTYCLVGYAELSDNAYFKREALYDFATLIDAKRGSLTFQGEPRPIEDHQSCSDLAGLAMNLDYPRASEVYAALGWGSGSMLLRDTRGPSTEGTTLVAMLMVLNLPSAILPDAHMASLTMRKSGNGQYPSFTTLDIEGPCPIKTNGSSLSQVHQAPIWGWDEEPYGFRSLLRLDVIDDCTKLQNLIIEDSSDHEEIRRLQKRTMRSIQDNSDPLYARYRKRMAAEGFMRPWDQIITASEQTALSSAADRILRELMEEDA